MQPLTQWIVGYELSDGTVAVLSGSPRFDTEQQAIGEAAQRTREKPFLRHVAVRAQGPLYDRD